MSGHPCRGLDFPFSELPVELGKVLSIDRIEYEVTVQISAAQDGVCERVRGMCVLVP